MPTFYIRSRRLSLPERIAYGVLVALLLVLGFFFLAAALVAGAIVAGALLVRFWWLKRKLDKAAVDGVITTEYTVVEREPAGARLPVAEAIESDWRNRRR